MEVDYSLHTMAKVRLDANEGSRAYLVWNTPFILASTSSPIIGERRKK